MSRVFVTLVISEKYVPGALVLSQSLHWKTPGIPRIVMVSPDLSSTSIQHLSDSFERLVYISPIRSKDLDSLELLGRPDLLFCLSKLHVFDPDLTWPAEKAVFLDADTLILNDISGIFDYLNDNVDFAASPDIGWPDCFNSGVFVFRPSKQLFHDILSHFYSHGSFDGGDQGILNSFFSNWADSNAPSSYKTNRLPFVFNVTPSTSYSYLPAYMRHASNIKIVHFIGSKKPWDFDRFSTGDIVPVDSMPNQTLEMLKEWWHVFDFLNLELKGFTSKKLPGPNTMERKIETPPVKSESTITQAPIPLNLKYEFSLASRQKPISNSAGLPQAPIDFENPKPTRTKSAPSYSQKINLAQDEDLHLRELSVDSDSFAEYQRQLKNAAELEQIKTGGSPRRNKNPYSFVWNMAGSSGKYLSMYSGPFAIHQEERESSKDTLLEQPLYAGPSAIDEMITDGTFSELYRVSTAKRSSIIPNLPESVEMDPITKEPIGNAAEEEGMLSLSRQVSNSQI